jgi:hypothetical protein
VLGDEQALNEGGTQKNSETQKLTGLRNLKKEKNVLLEGNLK